MNRQSFSLYAGAVTVWFTTLNVALEAAEAIAAGDWLLAAFKVGAAVGGVMIGRDIWRTA